MTLEEFISLDPKKIRRDKQLMQLFVNFYKAAFSLEPNCAGCVFNRGFDKLKRFAKKGEKKINFTKKTIMEKTFTVKARYRGKILTYKEGGIVYRKYGNNLDEAFALKLVEHGKSEVFAKLPEAVKMTVRLQLTDGTTEDYTVYSDEIKQPSEATVDALADKEREKLLNSQGLDKYSQMDWKEEILPLYAETRERTGEKAKSRSKNDVIAFIRENENN